MRLMYRVLPGIAVSRKGFALLSSAVWAGMLLLTACATHTEPLIHRVREEVIREGPVEATRVVSNEV